MVVRAKEGLTAAARAAAVFVMELGGDVVRGLGFGGRRRYSQSWMRFATVRESHGRVCHRATGESDFADGRDYVFCSAEPIKVMWHFRSARGEGWMLRDGFGIIACPGCEAAWVAAGSPPVADRVPAELL